MEDESTRRRPVALKPACYECGGGPGDSRRSCMDFVTKFNGNKNSKGSTLNNSRVTSMLNRRLVPSCRHTLFYVFSCVCGVYVFILKDSTQRRYLVPFVAEGSELYYAGIYYHRREGSTLLLYASKRYHNACLQLSASLSVDRLQPSSN